MTSLEFENLSEKQSAIRQIFTWKPTDKYIVSCMISTTLIVWFFLYIHNCSSGIMLYGEGPLIMHISKHLYKTPSREFANKTENYFPQAVYTIPIGSPILIKILKMCCLGFWTPAIMIYILATNTLCAILFERFISSWQLVQNPVLTACLLSIFPSSYLIVHSTLSTDAIYLSCVFFVFIGYKLHDTKIMFRASLLAMLFDRQGFILAISFFVLFFRIGHYGSAFQMLSTIIISYSLHGIIFMIRGGPFFGMFIYYFLYNPRMKIIPFAYLLETALSIGSLEEFHVNWLIFITTLVGTAFLSRYSVSLLIFCIGSLIYQTMNASPDVGRFAVTVDVFCVLIGFDTFINSVRFKKVLPTFCVIFYVFVTLFTVNSIKGRGYKDTRFIWYEL